MAGGDAVYGIYTTMCVVFLIVFPRILTKKMFYNNHTDEWHLRKKWHYYAVYAIWTLVFLVPCTIPFTDIYMRISEWFLLETGQAEFIQCSLEKEDILQYELPDNEFVVMYKVESGCSIEKLENEIIPKIMEKQRRFKEIRVLNQDYTMKYDIDSGLYQIRVKTGIIAEIEIKRTRFFIKIYLHGYLDEYEEYQRMGENK